MSQPLFGELDVLHSNEGVLIGTAGLARAVDHPDAAGAPRPAVGTALVSQKR